KRASLPTSVAQALLERGTLLDRIDTSPVLEAAAGVTATAVSRELFINIGEARSSLGRFGPLNATLHSYRRSSAVQSATDAIIEAMLEIIGRRAPVLPFLPTSDPGVLTVASEAKHDAVRETIVRKAIANLPAAHTLEGIVWSVESVWNREATLLLLLVIWLSELKPYIEGRIAFSSELRGYYEALGEALGLHVKIGTMRQAYWSLSHGARAIWTLDPRPREVAEIRSNASAARFVKRVQHLFVGSAVRTQAIHALTTHLAKRTHVSVKRIHEALSAVTNTTHSTRT
ncbi:MAG: hypothetical protein M3N19_07065, partial [Candidatus Eremiobacteraeota bacterium]|nr:hypothetical protein [Candidatus Eremiobacteraeota bacterium]